MHTQFLVGPVRLDYGRRLQNPRKTCYTRKWRATYEEWLECLARCAARTAVSEEEGLSAATDALCERIGAKVRNISATGAQFPRAAVESLGRDLDALADRAQKEQSFVKRARRVSVAVA